MNFTERKLTTAPPPVSKPPKSKFQLFFKSVGVFVIFLVLFGSCSSKLYNAEQLPACHLSFGSGGGFSGLVSEYALLETGQIVEKRRNGNQIYYEEVVKVSKSTAKDCFKRIKTVEDFDSNDASYSFSYLKSCKADGKMHEIRWGSNTILPNEIKELYTQLIGFLPKK
ncbi:MAG: hypothetical protein RL757_2134 [Bacteroidota bacterium]|jgi:hypothetical protein